MNKGLYWAALTLGAGALLGQEAALTRRATPTGRGGDGKCIIEVEVDGAAEVEMSGDMGLLRTLAGQTAAWRRFECNGPLPRNPGEFRFRGIDGRGNVHLVRDPRNSRGRAVVRSEDPKGGREGYTFDLEWEGLLGGRLAGRQRDRTACPRRRRLLPCGAGHSSLPGDRGGPYRAGGLPVCQV